MVVLDLFQTFEGPNANYFPLLQTELKHLAGTLQSFIFTHFNNEDTGFNSDHACCTFIDSHMGKKALEMKTNLTDKCEEVSHIDPL